MSYDIRLATHEKPSQELVDAWLSERDAFRAEGALEEGLSILRLRGKTAKPSFEVTAPTTVLDVEDLDEELATAVVAPRWFLEVSAPYGLADQDYAAARALAKHLSRESKGAAFDPQSDKLLWPPKTGKRTNIPSTPERIRVIHLQWFFDLDTMAGDGMPEQLLHLLRLHLADAVPRRFGEYEPPRRRLEEDGDEGFSAFWDYVRNEPLNSFYWKARSPCFGGTISFPSKWAKSEDGRPTGYIKVSLDGRVIEVQKAWREAAVDLFTAMSSQLGAFYAAGYVERNVEARRGFLWYGPGAEHISLMGKAWQGLPRDPVWMSYFSLDYAAELQNELDAFETTPLGTGMVVRLGDEPLDRDQIRESSSWFSEDVLAPPREGAGFEFPLAEKTNEPSRLGKLRRRFNR